MWYTPILVLSQHPVSVHLRTANDIGNVVCGLAIDDQPLERCYAFSDHGQMLLHRRGSVAVADVSYRTHVLLQVGQEVHEGFGLRVRLL